MKRIVVVTSGQPFGEGGHLVIARSLVAALREAGHAAEVVVTPQNRFGRQGAAYVGTWLTDVGLAQDGGPIDQVISLRYPAYAVRHDAHVCWLTHRMREYYDLWDELAVTLTPVQRVKERLRRALIHRADHFLLTRNVHRLFVISGTVQRRLERWGRIPSTVLYPPPPLRPYRCDEYGDYIFAVSRLTPLKRLDLLVRAMACPQADGLRAVIAGDGEARASLAGLVRELGLESRVRLVGDLSGDGLLEHFGRCRAVCFPTRNEDYGFVTVEAFASRKAVVACTDGGGPAEVVQNGVSGFVTAPEPASIAEALNRLMEDKALAVRMGEAGWRTVAEMTWARVAEQVVLG